MVLNIAILIACLPVVTIGKALTAAFELLFLNKENKKDIRFKSYFQLFSQNMLLDISIFLMDTSALLLCFYLINGLPDIVKILGLLILALFLLLSLTMLSVRAVTQKNMKKTYQLSFAILLKYLYASILSFVAFVISGLFLIFLPKLFILWIFFGISLPVKISGFLFYPIFIKLGLLE